MAATGPRLTPDQVRDFSRLSVARASWAVAVNWAAVVAIAAGALLIDHWAAYVLAWPLMGAAQHGLAILMHEAAHWRLYEDRRWNDWIGRLCAIPVGISLLSYRRLHIRHHSRLYRPEDPDLPLFAGYPRGRTYLLKRLGRDLLGLTVSKNFAYLLGRTGRAKGSAEGTGHVVAETPAMAATLHRDRMGALAGQVLLLAAAVLSGFGIEYALLWLLPIATSLSVLLRLRAICEHGARPEVEDALVAARTTLARWPLNWLIFPHQVGYHTVHHLYPSVPQYRLADCHRAMAAAGMLERTEVSGVRATLGRLFADPPMAA